MPAGLSHTGHHIRRHERCEQPRSEVEGASAELHGARRIERQTAHHLSGQGEKSQSGDCKRMKGDPVETQLTVQDPDGPVVAPGHTYESVTERIGSIVISLRTPRQWWIGAGIAFLVVNMLMTAIAWLFWRGVGIWGINVPVAWGFAIVNFVWWIGIGHAGTLISAILLLLKQDWRTSINRFSDAMTLFAVACAGMFPILHLGRPCLADWLIPYPNTMWLWPQPRSPLIWDVFAVSTYATG